MTFKEGFIYSFLQCGTSLAPILRRAVAQGIEAEYARKLLDLIEAQEHQRRISQGEIPTAGLLSERKLEVLRLVADNCSNQEIADRLFISLSTAKSHVQHIYAKLDAKDRLQAVTRARELKLI